ncbi:MAG TPA: serine kinase [Xanthobacteraceae bacterium]|nr:serine kinase [Xanthobacteraceae bacterium]
MPTIHASVVLVGARAMLIRGTSGSGKSHLVWAMIEAAACGRLPFANLVADDRVHIFAAGGRLLAKPPENLAGLLEVHGLGIRRLPHEPLAVVGWVVDLGADAERMPAAAGCQTELLGVTLPRFAFPPCADPLPVLLAALRTSAAQGEPGTRW